MLAAAVDDDDACDEACYPHTALISTTICVQTHKTQTTSIALVMRMSIPNNSNTQVGMSASMQQQQKQVVKTRAAVSISSNDRRRSSQSRLDDDDGPR